MDKFLKSDETYFAAKDAKDTSTILMNKANNWFLTLNTNGYLEKIRQCWAAYHGAYYNSFNESHSITFGGEQGELSQIAVNHLRNIAQNMLVMITSTRPALQARASNGDYTSLVQTKLANGLLDYYLREKRLEKYLKTAAEYAIVMGAGFIKMEWSATTGEIHDYIETEVTDEDTGEIRIEQVPEYQGDVVFTNLSPFDVVFDDNVQSSMENDWVLCRTFKNKYDLIAKYPERKQKILSLPVKSDLYSVNLSNYAYSETELVAIYEFYHKRTETLPEGRYIMFLDEELVLVDTEMPYRDLPVYRMAANDILGTTYGYAPIFDLLPIQDAVNSLYSTILTNQSTFGVQNIWVPRGADVSIAQLSGGLNIVEGNTGFEPKPLNLTETPTEVFNFMDRLVKDMETISGVNSVARGNPEASLRSGNALALVQSMALQFMSGLQQTYVQCIEDVGTGLINMLKDFATAPRIAAIVGENNKTYLKEFKGDNLSNVNRVIVDIGNPLARCLEKDTPILMYDGSIEKVQDIIVGDKVMGPDSKARTVNNVNTGTEMMYKITSKDSNRKVSYGCNESHILTLKYCSDDHRYNAKKGDIIDISVRDYLKLPKRQKRLLQGFKVGVEFSKKDTIVPAYILGTWLGDGNSANTGITTMDNEIVEAWSQYADSIGMQLRTSTSESSGQAKTYYITSGKTHGKSDRNPFMNELRSMEVINNKHIPDIYLKTSRDERLELLAGLIDTDGSRVDETFVFTQKDDRLSTQVMFLAQSLGFRVTSKKVKSIGGAITGYFEGETNKITIGGNTWEIPTRLLRKQTKPKTKSRDWLNYGIEVTAVGEGEYFGFTLEEDPHFVLGDFTVTHNTTAGKVQMAEQMLQMGLIDTPQQYLTVIETGRLEGMVDDKVRQQFLMTEENEKLVNGESVIAMITDQHMMHIKEHSSVLSDPELRFDPELVGRVTAHIQEHINVLRTTDPDLLTALGQQPLAPQGAPQPVNPGQVQGAPSEQLEQPEGQQAPENSVPSVDPAMLPNPELQEAAMGNVKPQQ